jgi:site-specific DNA-methyltransferase (adenine-specific)
MGTVKLGNCFNLFSEIADNSIDAIITDPPYNSTDVSWDKILLDRSLFLENSLRILKKNGYLCSFGSIELLGDISKIFPLRWSGVWLKSNSPMRTHTAKKPRCKSEPYAVFAHPEHEIKDLTFNQIIVPGTPYKTVQRHQGVRDSRQDSLARSSSARWTQDGYVSENLGTRQQTAEIESPNKTGMKHAERTKHPTQKPIKVISTLIQWITNPGDLVLDPFCGSGTTAIACLENDRDYICYEMNEEYFEMTNNRIKEWHKTNGTNND